MSSFLHHESCPNCGSKDNLAVFSDGHKFCFGCKYYEAGTLSVKQVFSDEPALQRRTTDYPWDACDDIPSAPTKWLLGCGVDFSIQKQFGIQWSPSRQLLCWKVRNVAGEIIAWQGRNFNPEVKVKYISHGKIHEEISILGYPKKDTCVFVEDFISAIRVSTHLPCMPLFGCTCSLNALQQARTHFNHVIIWLDADKLDNARKIGLNANLVGLGSSVLYTPKDPKEYSSTEIKEFLETVIP